VVLANRIKKVRVQAFQAIIIDLGAIGNFFLNVAKEVKGPQSIISLRADINAI